MTLNSQVSTDSRGNGERANPIESNQIKVGFQFEATTGDLEEKPQGAEQKLTHHIYEAESVNQTRDTLQEGQPWAATATASTNPSTAQPAHKGNLNFKLFLRRRYNLSSPFLSILR